MRIRGQIGGWPVDLTLELDPQEWAQLGRAQAPAPEPAVPVAQAMPAARADDGQWNMACDVLRQAGRLDGPELLGRLEALSGGTSAAKRLLVRLRHSGQVKVESGADAPVYIWLD